MWAERDVHRGRRFRPYIDCVYSPRLIGGFDINNPPSPQSVWDQFRLEGSYHGPLYGVNHENSWMGIVNGLPYSDTPGDTHFMIAYLDKSGGNYVDRPNLASFSHSELTQLAGAMQYFVNENVLPGRMRISGLQSGKKELHRKDVGKQHSQSWNNTHVHFVHRTAPTLSIADQEYARLSDDEKRMARKRALTKTHEHFSDTTHELMDVVGQRAIKSSALAGKTQIIEHDGYPYGACSIDISNLSASEVALLMKDLHAHHEQMFAELAGTLTTHTGSVFDGELYEKKEREERMRVFLQGLQSEGYDVGRSCVQLPWIAANIMSEQELQRRYQRNYERSAGKFANRLFWKGPVYSMVMHKSHGATTLSMRNIHLSRAGIMEEIGVDIERKTSDDEEVKYRRITMKKNSIQSFERLRQGLSNPSST